MKLSQEWILTLVGTIAAGVGAVITRFVEWWLSRGATTHDHEKTWRAELREEIKGLREEIKELKRHQVEVENRNDELITERATLAAQVSILSAKVESLGQRVTYLQDRAVTAVGERDDWKSRALRAERERDAQRERIRTLEGRVKTLEQHVASLEAERSNGGGGG